jgi:hypothetical protein
MEQKPYNCVMGFGLRLAGPMMKGHSGAMHHFQND